MGRQGIKISEAEHEKILEQLAKGYSPRQMQMSVGRSPNAIYEHLRKKGIKLEKQKTFKPKEVYRLPEEPDYSKLPNDLYFNWKMFPSF